MRITDRGKHVLERNLEKLDAEFLREFPEFVEFKDARLAPRGKLSPAAVASSTDQTPEEVLERANEELRLTLAHELLLHVKQAPPSFFEQLVVDLLVRMGYGGSREDAGRVVGKSGDGGIDGIINEDRLGLDVIYIKAKRWENTVGRPELQRFVGALQGKRSRKGIFITTSAFTREASEYAQSIDQRVTLIDGGRLAELMIDFNIGVSPVETYTTKRIDTDYFEQD